MEENNTLHATSLFKPVATAAFLSLETLGATFARAVQSAMPTMR